MLTFDSRRATATRGSDGLSVFFILYIACGENSRHIGFSRPRFGDDIADFICF